MDDGTKAPAMGRGTTGVLVASGVVLAAATVWSSLPVAQLHVGAGGGDAAHEELVEGQRPEELSAVEVEQLEALGYVEARPRSRGSARPRRNARSTAATPDEEHLEQLRMLGYTSSEAVPRASSPPASRSASMGRSAPDLAVRPPVLVAPSGFQLAANQPLSTFAADVDDASWVRTRERVASGGRPDPDEVRAEELVNAMPYAYPDPLLGKDFGVATEIVAHPGHPGRQLVRIGVQGRRMAAAERPPVHLTFLVDTSCSMQGRDQLPLAKVALASVAEQLGPRDTVALVTFADATEVRLPATAADTEGRRDFLDAVASLGAAGGTGMDMGLDLAYQQATHERRDVLSRVVLVSDGDANIGRLSGTAMAQTIEDRAREGVQLTALGFGTNAHGDQVLEELSNRGDGQYFAIADEDDVRHTLEERFVQTFVPLARDVKLQVEWDPEVVRSYRLVGYDDRRLTAAEFRQDAVDAGEVGMGHQVTALYVVERLPGTDEQALGVLRIRHEPAGPDIEAREDAVVLHGPVVPSPARASRDTVVALSAASLAGALRGEPMLPLSEVEPLLERAIDGSQPQADLLATVRTLAREERRPRAGVQGRSGVVSLRTEPGAFREVAVHCDGEAVATGTFRGGRAVVAGVPDGSCTADLRGRRPTVSLAVAEGSSYRCDGQPLRCRAEE